MKTQTAILFILSTVIANIVLANGLVIPENHTQTLRGRVIDKQTNVPLPGVNLIILDEEPTIGTITDSEGYFEISGLPIGRIKVGVSMIGYHKKTLPNVQLSSGKETILNIQLEEKIYETELVVVKANNNKTEPMNNMAPVSARSFTIEETQRFAGARNDVSRMATNYAGVSTANDAVNDIVIRGNSPNGLLWQLEGIPIPNPNHFGAMGNTGGPVSMLNNNVLTSSDFFTSAFPAEYGNALSGVFDLKLRNGNYSKYEFLGQIGFNGFELGAEGPVNKENHSSYLLNYRYSTLGLMQDMGIEFGTGTAVPKYQDMNFNVNLPTDKLGKFKLFGLGGINSIEFVNSQEGSDGGLYQSEGLDIYSDNKMGVVGLSHNYIFNSTTYTKFSLAYTGIQNEHTLDSIDPENGEIFPANRSNLVKENFIADFLFNKKLNKQNHFKLGASTRRISYNLQTKLYKRAYQDFITGSDANDFTWLNQGYLHWKFKPSDLLTFNIGLHGQHLALNNKFSLEPRVSMKWKYNPNQSASLGYGLHSQMIPMHIYFAKTELEKGLYAETNRNLGFLKSHHWVAGYHYRFSRTFRLKAEVYYQKLFDAAVEQRPSSFSSLNISSMVWNIPDSLVNRGTGKNYGVDITFEKFLDKGFYFLTTASLFESKYKGSDGIERFTVFDGGYVFNILGGKEFKLNFGSDKRETRLLVDIKLTTAGGQKYTPVDLEASIADKKLEYMDRKAFSKQFDPYFRMDTRVAFKMDGKNVTQEWAFDVQNITDAQNPLYRDFDVNAGEVKTVNQLGLFPMMQYKIVF